MRRWFAAGSLALAALAAGSEEKRVEKRAQITVRGVYGGVPTDWLDQGKSLAAYGVNAVWIGSGGVTEERVGLLKRQGALVFAEFNTMHEAGYLKEHPDAAPVGADGKVSPPPDGWQGICPTHAGYRKHRMEAFRDVLARFDVDGIWLDYHHGHASWEQAVPNMPDTCFCDRCLARFERETGTKLPEGTAPERARRLLGALSPRWVQWRCDIFTDWVREFRDLMDAAERSRPAGRAPRLLGTFHCPWSEEEFDGALKKKLAIDLKAQAKYLDVFSIMPYHARFGHAAEPAWISRQTGWLGRHLGIEGRPGERLKIWPIAQLADWGETVPVEQVATVLEHATRAPATGVMVFHWSGLAQKPEKGEALGRFYREIAP
jgi:hypothetical protein